MWTLNTLLSRYQEYPAYVAWRKSTSRRSLKEPTLIRELQYLDTLRLKIPEQSLKLKGSGPRLSFGLDFSLTSIPAILANAKLVSVQVRDSTHLSAVTKSLYLLSIRDWLRFRSVTPDTDLTSLLKKISGDRVHAIQRKDLLTPDELLNIFNHTKSIALRAFYMTLFDLGCRPGELCNCDTSDIAEDEHGFQFNFSETKNEQSHRQIRLLMPKAIAAFQSWWSMHPRRQDKSAPVFINSRGERFKPQSLIHILRHHHNDRLGRGGNNGKCSLSLYLFRKSRATQHAREKKFSEMEIKMRMGHKKNSTMLESYYAILEQEDLSDAELRTMGVTDSKSDSTPAPITCSNCGAPNDAGSDSCFRCKHPLTEQEVIRRSAATGDNAKLRDEIEFLKTRLDLVISKLGVDIQLPIEGSKLSLKPHRIPKSKK